MSDATSLLGIAHPIVQGPFGGGLSTEVLAATVSELGGLGSFGAHMLAPDELAGLTARLRARTSKPFAINLWVSDHDPGGTALTAEQYERAAAIYQPYADELGVTLPAPPATFGQRFADQVEALLAAAPPVFSFVFGVPPAPVLAECRRKGIVTVGAATSIAEARALDEAGVDVIVASGCEAGGHRPTFLGRAEDALMGTLALVPLVVDRVQAPVIAAGGIVDKRGVRAVQALGATAAQLGTAFLACEESNAPDAHRAYLFSPRSHHTTLTRTFTGRLARGLANRWTQSLAPRVGELPPYPIPSWFAGQLRAAGQPEMMSLWSGQAAPNLRHHNAADLFASLID